MRERESKRESETDRKRQGEIRELREISAT